MPNTPAKEAYDININYILKDIENRATLEGIFMGYVGFLKEYYHGKEILSKRNTPMAPSFTKENKKILSDAILNRLQKGDIKNDGYLERQIDKLEQEMASKNTSNETLLRDAQDTVFEDSVISELKDFQEMLTPEKKVDLQNIKPNPVTRVVTPPNPGLKKKTPEVKITPKNPIDAPEAIDLTQYEKIENPTENPCTKEIATKIKNAEYFQHKINKNEIKMKVPEADLMDSIEKLSELAKQGKIKLNLTEEQKKQFAEFQSNKSFGRGVVS